MCAVGEVVRETMAHAKGWIDAYGCLEDGRPIPEHLLKTILTNRNRIGETFFHWYAIEGTVEVVAQIINLGFDVNTQNDFKATPLLECLQIHRWDMAELLLKHGADPSIRNKYEQDVWYMLASQRRFDCLERLDRLMKKRSG